MKILELLGIFILNDISFMLMFYFAFKIAKSERIKTPIEAIKDHKEIAKKKKEQKIEAENLTTMLENINNYDGTSKGQKDLK